ncbi:hypothetical protein ACFX11_027039 [Malus domestica]
MASSASSSAGYGCAEFQKLSKTKGGRESGDEDKMLEELAMKNKWRRCPGCKNYVEKSGGCDVINCRSDTSASASYYFSWYSDIGPFGLSHTQCTNNELLSNFELNLRFLFDK